MDTFIVVYEDGTVIEGLSFEESYKLFKDAHRTDNQARVHSSLYGRDLKVDPK